MLQAIEFMAVIASAIYGILLACRKEMDVVGVIAVAFAVA
ncbi:MAG: putative membrane protein YeiH, partial [Pseudoalteromonas tetraodonis]